jgi:hypothetical protein
MTTTPRLLLAALAILFAGVFAGLLLGGGSTPATSPAPLPSNEAPSDPPSPSAPTDDDGYLEIVINPDGRLGAEGATLVERAGVITLAVIGAHLEPVQLLIGIPDGAGSLLPDYTFTFEAGIVGEGEITLAAGSYEIWTVPVTPGPESRLSLTITE